MGGEGSQFILVRLLPDGGMDTTFGVSGVVHTPFPRNSGITSLLLTADGILATEYYNFGAGALARYDESETIDPGFGDGGVVMVGLTQERFSPIPAVIQPDGRIQLTARRSTYVDPYSFSRLEAVRLHGDGTLDESYGIGGRALVGFREREPDTRGFGPYPGSISPGAAAIGADGKLVFGGWISLRTVAEKNTSTWFGPGRLLESGALDESFGTSGYSIIKIDTAVFEKPWDYENPPPDEGAGEEYNGAGNSAHSGPPASPPWASTPTDGSWWPGTRTWGRGSSPATIRDPDRQIDSRVSLAGSRSGRGRRLARGGMAVPCIAVPPDV